MIHQLSTIIQYKIRGVTRPFKQVVGFVDVAQALACVFRHNLKIVLRKIYAHILNI